MANAIFQRPIVDETGRALPGATLAVYDETGTTLQTIYDASGSPITNPLVADPDGEALFYIPTGIYYLQARHGASVRDYPGVAIGTSLVADEAITLLFQGV